MTTAESGATAANDEGPLRSNLLARAPSAWMTRFAAGLGSGASVLDLACGHGRNARWLAERGCRVTAVDADDACAVSLADTPGVEFLRSDLEAGPWPLMGRRFDAVIVIHYLHRPLFPALGDALAPGGLLIYETFAQGNERFGRPRNPDFLLRPGELLQAFAGLRVIAFEDGFVAEPEAMVQRLAARKLAHGANPAPERLRL